MKSDFGYLNMLGPIRFSVVAGTSPTSFNALYIALFQDLMLVEENYRLLKRLDILLNDETAKDLSDRELKIGLRSCAYSIVQAACRILEQPLSRNQKKTNCLYTRIQKDINCDITKDRFLARYRELIDTEMYQSLKSVRDKYISHQEGLFEDISISLIGDFLLNPQPMQTLIHEIKNLLVDTANITAVGPGRMEYISHT